MKDLVWDDAAFKERVKAAARRKGITVSQALQAAGVSPYYLKKTVVGRGANTVIQLARVLDVPPDEMFGLQPAPTKAGAEPGTSPQPARSKPAHIDGERLRRITIVAEIIAEQLAALLYVIADRSDADPLALIEKILREVRGFQHSSAERDGNNK